MLALTLVAGACGGGDGDDEDAVPDTEATPDPDATPTPTPEPVGEPPSTGDHWHVPFGLYVCDDLGSGFVSGLEVTTDTDDFSSPGDGIIHIHPATEAATGDAATLGAFFEALGFDLSDTGITVSTETGPQTVDEGFECDAEPTVLQVARWHLDDIDAEPEVFTEGLADVVFEQDLDVITVAYLPDGAEIPVPSASIGALATITDVAPEDVPALPDGFTVAVVDPPGDGAAITEGETPCPGDDAERTTTFAQAPPDCLDDGVSYEAVFHTTEGDVRVALDTDDTPNTVNNFVVLARYGYYDDTALFRTDPSIDIIQGGSPHTNSPSDQGPGYTIVDEGEFVTDEDTGAYTGPYTYEPGDLVMARSAGPDSSGAQFFFSAGPNTAVLDSQGTYIDFGDVTEGLDVLESILGLHVDDPTSGLGGGPSRAVVIESIEIIES